ncbi:MAG: hypothetical protein LBD16_08285 [Oscillospiraceae bacterium]|jgi:hypothetical protein|nr:hypothetical protein [Oscillospiraceae bacterium]
MPDNLILGHTSFAPYTNTAGLAATESIAKSLRETTIAINIKPDTAMLDSLKGIAELCKQLAQAIDALSGGIDVEVTHPNQAQ